MSDADIPFVGPCSLSFCLYCHRPIYWPKRGSERIGGPRPVPYNKNGTSHLLSCTGRPPGTVVG